MIGQRTRTAAHAAGGAEVRVTEYPSARGYLATGHILDDADRVERERAQRLLDERRSMPSPEMVAGSSVTPSCGRRDTGS